MDSGLVVSTQSAYMRQPIDTVESESVDSEPLTITYESELADLPRLIEEYESELDDL